MRTILRWILGLVFLVPALWLGYYTAAHLRMLYFPPDRALYSFGLILRYGAIEILDPWSDMIAIVSIVLLLIAGIATILNTTRKIKIQAAAVLLFVIFLLGLIS